MKLTDVVRTQLPDFAWQTLDEALWYLEQIDERITYELLAVYMTWPSILCCLDMKLGPQDNRKTGPQWIRMYKRKSAPPNAREANPYRFLTPSHATNPPPA